MTVGWDSARPAYAGGLGWRHAVALLVFTIVLICYADRTNMGLVLAQTNLSADVEAHKGIVLSSFFIGYICTQIPGSWLARRYGAKPTLLLAASIWTTFDVLTPFAAELGLVPLLLARIGMGLGEGMTFPSQYGLTSFWVPTAERSFLVNFMTSGQDVGSVLASAVTPQIAVHGAWLVFVSWGSVALLWCVVFLTLGASAPEVHGPCLRSGEAEWIAQNRKAQAFEQARAVRERMIPRRLVREPCIWAIFAGHVGVNYAWYVMLSWMPTFFKGRFDLCLTDNPITLAAPYLCAWLGGVSSGKVADMLILRGVRTRHVRKGMQVTGALCSALLFQLAALSGSSTWGAIWVSLALLCAKFQNAGYWVNMVDVCPESAASCMGMSNTIATIPGIVGQPITQAILNWAGGCESAEAWSVVFGVGGVVGLCAATVFGALGDDRSLDEALPQTLPLPAQEGDSVIHAVPAVIFGAFGDDRNLDDSSPEVEGIDSHALVSNAERPAAAA